MGNIDLLTASAEDLSKLLHSQNITSESLVTQYLDQIERHNQEGLKIRAVIQAAHRDSTLELARELDRERAEKGSRGPLHGIPILVKDVFFTPSAGLPTTLGSAAFTNATSSRDADVVSLLLKAGAIIIGKANLSEFGNYKGAGLKPGWSVTGGQTQSPYVRGGVLPNATMLGHSTPAGSSAGPAAGVAAGFAALAISTETDGSTVQPATRAALYGMKGTLGSIPTWGSQPITPVLDTVGGMAKSAGDLAHLFEILQGRNYTDSLDASWAGIKVGFVDPKLWQPASFVVEPVPEFTAQAYREYAAAVHTVRSQGAKVVENVPLVNVSEIFKDGVEGVEDTDAFMGADFDKAFTDFLQGYENSNIKSLAHLVKWIEDHAELELPSGADQSVLIGALNNDMSRETFDAGLKHMRERSREKILESFAQHDVDVILGPADGRIASVAACAGYPVASIPLGFADFNGRAFGLNVIAPSNSEGRILRLMSAWEATFPHARAPPPLLVNWESDSSIVPQL